MRYAALLAAVVVLLSAVAGPAAALAASGPTAGADAATQPPSARAVPADAPAALTVGAPRTNFTIVLRADADAEWTVETTIPLSDDADREAFREYADAYEAGEAAGGPSIELFRNAAAQASEVTGREMSIGSVNRSTDLEGDAGTLRLRFTWAAFLQRGDNETLVLGDAFETPNNGTWLGSLSASQRLVVVPPESYEVSDVSDGFRRSIDDRRIVVRGPQTFEPGDIEIAYTSTAGGLDLPIAWIVGGGAVLLVAVVVLAYRRGGLGAAEVVVPDVALGDGDTEARASADGADASTSAGDGVPGGGPAGTPTAGSDANGSRTGTDGVAAGAAATTDAEEDLELLSDEERVERLLERNGGRMRQGDIVSGTGWSDAKVSQLLSAMADDGRIEKLRLGRENLISLADEADTDGDDESSA